jgi:hypothetical protein
MLPFGRLPIRYGTRRCETYVHNTDFPRVLLLLSASPSFSFSSSHPPLLRSVRYSRSGNERAAASHDTGFDKQIERRTLGHAYDRRRSDRSVGAADELAALAVHLPLLQ